MANTQYLISKKKEKKYLVIINLFSQINFAFFTIFFNIFTYQITQNINIVLLCLIVSRLSMTSIHYIAHYFHHRRTLDIMFRVGFLICILCTSLTFFITPERLVLVFIVRILYGISEGSFYIPYEISVMSKNSKNQMRKFVGAYDALGIVAAVLSPFISGYLIDYLSIKVLFIFMIICTIICFYISFQIHFMHDRIEHISLPKYLSVLRQDKYMQMGYFGYAIGVFAKNGAVENILPVLIFMKTGTNYSVGIYSALSALLCGIAIILYSQYCRKKHVGLWINTIINIIVSFILIASNSIVVFFIYYFIHNINRVLMNTDINSSLFVLTYHSELQPYLIEHKTVYNTLATITISMSAGLCLLLYNFYSTALSISIFLILSALSQIISTILIYKSDNVLNKTKKFQYQIPNNI